MTALRDQEEEEDPVEGTEKGVARRLVEKEGLVLSLGLVGEALTSDGAFGMGVSGTLWQGRGLGGQEVGQQNTPGSSAYLGRGEGNGMVVGEQSGSGRLVWFFVEFPERCVSIGAEKGCAHQEAGLREAQPGD